MAYKDHTNVVSEGSSTAEKSPVIRIRDLHKSFGSNHVLRGIDMDVYPGESVAVLGKSGSGKSVLIKCMVGLMTPDSGQLQVYGHEVAKLNQSSLDELRRRIGFLFQSNALYDSMTVRENLLFPMRKINHQRSKEELDTLILEILASVGLEHSEYLMPAELSGGMRKRIGLARTLIMKPDVILYDEPTTGLDPITSKGISKLMLAVHEQYQTSSVIISHDMNCIKRTAQRIIVLINGINYAEGTYLELSKSKDPLVKAFFES